MRSFGPALYTHSGLGRCSPYLPLLARQADLLPPQRLDKLAPNAPSADIRPVQTMPPLARRRCPFLPPACLLPCRGFRLILPHRLPNSTHPDRPPPPYSGDTPPPSLHTAPAIPRLPAPTAPPPAAPCPPGRSSCRSHPPESSVLHRALAASSSCKPGARNHSSAPPAPSPRSGCHSPPWPLRSKVNRPHLHRFLEPLVSNSPPKP